ncbi:MAG: tRNA (N6-threonylcarbamoyladenosine(37)-N6)-methyltransferase TrmO [Pseudomonadota bacterium]|nr:tRNA (N6-threonylcarbamoyladenosine(37)-N6)-methyltransferase TrmO [Pseudomonadota bacterium]
MPLSDSTFRFEPIGIVHSPYRDKFAVPRQPGLVPAARGELHLLGDCNRGETLEGLGGFSHLWLTFVFHRVLGQGWKPRVRPPRLGGNRRVGVFASRSPFRPNPIGLSAVRLDGIEERGGQWLLHLGGIDLVDGTPILDIKPYLPYADAIANARGGFADGSPPAVAVTFSDASRGALAALADRHPGLGELITQVLAQQPQPAYRGAGERVYGMALYDLDIRWIVHPHGCEVIAIEPGPAAGE